MKLTESKSTLTALCCEYNFELVLAVLTAQAPKFINTYDKKEVDESYQPSENLTPIGKLTGVFFMLLRYKMNLNSSQFSLKLGFNSRLWHRYENSGYDISPNSLNVLMQYFHLDHIKLLDSLMFLAEIFKDLSVDIDKFKVNQLAYTLICRRKEIMVSYILLLVKLGVIEDDLIMVIKTIESLSEKPQDKVQDKPAKQFHETHPAFIKAFEKGYTVETISEVLGYGLNYVNNLKSGRIRINNLFIMKLENLPYLN